MKNYNYQNTLVSKKQLKQILAWSFTKYDCVRACSLAEELKSLGFKYATKAGISISIEDLKVPFVKNLIVRKASDESINSERMSINGQITEVEKFQKIIDIWSFTSEILKAEVVSYFNSYDPLNSVYMMAFSGARGNLTQVRQLIGMRGLMSDPDGQLLNLPIKKNFREGLTITDYLISGYGARKGIVDTALKTANSGYLTRRLIDVAQDIVIKEKDCFTDNSCLLLNIKQTPKSTTLIYNQILGRLLNRPIYDAETNQLLVDSDTQLTPNLLRTIKHRKIEKFYIRSPFTCRLYRSICQKCYGWNLAEENLIDIGEAVGIIAGQSIGEPGTQLTMRTFHTGGIFTASTSQQLLSPIEGTIELSEGLKTSIIRTNRGENVLYTQNSGLLQIIPTKQDKKSIYFTLLRNTLVFVQNGQLVNKSSILCQFLDTSKQTKTETKYILSDFSGEVYIPKFPRINKTGVIDQLFWILSGNVYQAPMSSFLNFPNNYRINTNSYVFRTKILSKNYGFIRNFELNGDILQPVINILSEQYYLLNSNVRLLLAPIKKNNFLLSLTNGLNYSVNLRVKNGKILIPNLTSNNQAIQITNNFSLPIGGRLYYDFFFKSISNFFYTRKAENVRSKTVVLEKHEIYSLSSQETLSAEKNTYVFRDLELTSHRNAKTSGILTVKEKKNRRTEISIDTGLLYHLVQVEYPRGLILKTGEVVYKHLVQELFLLHKWNKLLQVSKKLLTSKVHMLNGIVMTTGQIVYEISLEEHFETYRNGLVSSMDQKFQLENIGTSLSDHIYYPGEFLFNHFWIKEPCIIKIADRTLNNLQYFCFICPLELYEIPSIMPPNRYEVIDQEGKKDSRLSFENNIQCSYKSGDKILSSPNSKLIEQFLNINLNSSTKNISIEIGSNLQKNYSSFTVLRKLSLSNYIAPTLREKELEWSFIAKKKQFVNAYTTLGYLEAVTKKPLKIIKLRVKFEGTKQILLILNDHCKLVEKCNFPNKQINEFLINETDLRETGKIIADNGRILTIQRGKPYFFPNCKDETYAPTKNLQYSLIPKPDLFYNLSLHDKKYVNSRFYDIRLNSVLSVRRFSNSRSLLNLRRFVHVYKKDNNGIRTYLDQPWLGREISFSQMLIKKEDKFYLCGIPVFLREILIKRKALSNQTLSTVIDPRQWKNVKKKVVKGRLNKKGTRKDSAIAKKTRGHLVFLQTTDLIPNRLKLTKNSRLEFASLIYFNNYKKKIFPSIHSITEDYFEQEINTIYCENGEFIEQGKTVALLKLEKEITDDIVQGLPRIESLLEARKYKKIGKTKPKSIKKGLLIGKTSIDPTFEYRKVGTTIKDDEKINPTYLLTIYFNYYAKFRHLTQKYGPIKSFRLASDFDATYRTFKKIQSLILNSVQAIYTSQGVMIADKHLELIIRQMTTKVQIIKTGGTPLLVHEVLDLYHIKYINEVSYEKNREPASYVPFLLGITKTALNNPSFISAASFQETTRVLTKAAIEGRKDWLKGLKENIVIGHLIPSGTGLKTCSHSFNKQYHKKLVSDQTFLKIRK